MRNVCCYECGKKYDYDEDGISALTVGLSISRLGLVQAKRLYIPSSQKGNISGQGSAYSGRKRGKDGKCFKKDARCAAA